MVIGRVTDPVLLPGQAAIFARTVLGRASQFLEMHAALAGQPLCTDQARSKCIGRFLKCLLKIAGTLEQAGAVVAIDNADYASGVAERARVYLMNLQLKSFGK